LFLAALSSTRLCAQFTQPSSQELQRTADPKAPGASAVYLNIEEITNDQEHYHSFYARIKVLEEKGKELATIELPYLKGETKIADIKARTIHADGTVIPFAGKPEDVLIARSTDKQYDRKVFTLPAVEVGSILEYRYRIEYDDNKFSSPYWEIQRPYFIHKAHYAFTPFKAFIAGQRSDNYLQDANGNPVNSLSWWHILPPGVAVQADTRGFHVDLVDVPPTPNEDWMPPIRSLLYKVFFYYENSNGEQQFWALQSKRWSGNINRLAEVNKPIRAAVSGLVTPGDSDLDKAKKLYSAVQALENTDFSRQPSDSDLDQLTLRAAKRAEETWSQKSGSSRDIALLYLAMLRAAGLKAYAMTVVNRDRDAFDPSYLSMDQFDDTVVILSTGGKEILLDPGEKMCPFLALNWEHSGATGLRQEPQKDRLFASTPMQAAGANVTTRTGDIFIDVHGVVTGDLMIAMTGQEALRWRQLTLQSEVPEVKKQFDQWLASVTPVGVEAHVDHFLALDDPNVSLMAMIKVYGSLGTPTSKRLLLPAFFLTTRGGHPFVDQEKRLTSVDMRYGEQISDMIVYHLPPGAAVEGIPPDTRIPWDGHASYVARGESETGQITFTRQLSRGFTLLKPEEYRDLRDFYQKIAAADRGQLVLTVPATASRSEN
jgi:hypothetical protein